MQCNAEAIRTPGSDIGWLRMDTVLQDGHIFGWTAAGENVSSCSNDALARCACICKTTKMRCHSANAASIAAQWWQSRRWYCTCRCSGQKILQQHPRGRNCDEGASHVLRY